MKKGQVWIFDIFIGIVIFLIAFSILMKVHANLSYERETIDEMYVHGKMISDMLLSEGSPEGWRKDNVSQIGLISDGRLDEAKVISFSDIPYSEARYLFRTRFHFLVGWKDNEGSPISIGGVDLIGKEDVSRDDLSDIGSDNIIVIRRLAVYNSSAVMMEVFLWE